MRNLRIQLALFSLLLLLASLNFSSAQNCTDTNCAECTADVAKCTKCKATFFVKNDVCTGCGSQCDECTSETVCTKCKATFFVKDNVCTGCGSQCDECTSETVCTKCSEGQYLKTDKTCGTECGAKEFKDDAATPKKCTACLASCATCKNATACDTCAANEYFKTDKTCGTECGAKEFKDDAATPKKCTACKEGCETCENANECKSCPAGQFLKSDKTCGTECGAKEFKDEAATPKKCTACLASCTTCKNATACDTCAANEYFKTDKTCGTECGANEFKDDGATPKKCTACKAGCETCDNANECKSCPTGQFLKTDKTCGTECGVNEFKDEAATPKKCSACRAGCATCENANECKTCPAGRFLNTQTKRCDLCIAGCTSCTTATDCTQCGPTLFLNQDDQNRSQCTLKCVNNLDSSNVRICTRCKELSPPANRDDTAECEECATGYNKDNRNLCTRCPSGTASVKRNATATNDNVCRKCKTNNCKECNPLNADELVPSVCTKCDDGYIFKNSSSCEKCNDKCATCDAQGNCITCKAPLYIRIGEECVEYNCPQSQFYNSQAKACQACVVQGCLVCDKFNGNICQVCSSNQVFNRREGKCVPPQVVSSAPCKFGAYLESDGSCVCTEKNTYYSATEGCKRISNTSCDSCYISSREGCSPFSFALKCQPGCLVQEQEESASCTKCKQQEIFITDTSDQAIPFPSPRYLDVDGQCKSCKQGCGACTALEKCSLCLPNFMMTKNADGTVSCTRPESQQKMCSDGFLPSMASVYYLNADKSNEQIKLEELFDEAKARSAFFTTDTTKIAYAVGVYGQPLIQGDELDEQARLYTVNTSVTPITIKYSFVASSQSERQVSDVEITVECVPCLFNCNGKCAPDYFLDSETNRCYSKCPIGYRGENATQPPLRRCLKIVSPESVIIRSSQIGANGRFINSRGLIAEAVISGFSNQTFTSYQWKITAESAPFSSLVTNNTITGVDLTKRTISIPQDKLVAGVTYKLEVTFSNGSSTFTGSRFITPLPNLATVSFESQQLPVNLISISKSSLQAGEAFDFSYALSQARVFQGSTWWFILHGEGIQTQVSDLRNELFTVKAPLVTEYTLLNLMFDVTDGRVTYRTIRQIEVTGAENSPQTLKEEFNVLKGTSQTVFRGEGEFKELPRLLRNLKKLATTRADQEQVIRTRILVEEFIDQGTCKDVADSTSCGGPTQGTCKKVNETDEQNTRLRCDCASSQTGDFCQLKNTISSEYFGIVSDILVKVGNFLNQTGTNQPKVDTYAKFLMYKDILWFSVEYLNDKSILPFTLILQRAQPMAMSADEVADLQVLYRRAYNFYWNNYQTFLSKEDKTISGQIEGSLYEIARISMIQNAKWSLDFNDKKLDKNIGSKLKGSFDYIDTFEESKKARVFKPAFTGVALEYSFDMLKDAQVAGLFSATVDKSLFQNVKGADRLIKGLYKVTAIDLTNEKYEEIKKTKVANGVKYSFEGLPEERRKKLACAYYDDQERNFVLDVDGSNGCVLTTPNKTDANNNQVPDNTKATCTCDHNTIFSLAEFTARATPRQLSSDAFNLSFALSFTLMLLFFLGF